MNSTGYFDKAQANPNDNVEEILEGFRVLLHDRFVYELRGLGGNLRGTVSGYFDAEHRREMAEEASRLSGVADGVFFTVNPVHPDLMARACNTCRGWAKHTTSDADILGRRWLPLDFDPVRPAGISSSDAEHAAALARAFDCAEWLKCRGFSIRSLVIADSGNGAHLLIRISLGNTPEETELVRRCIEAVAFQFTDPAVEVDQTTFNAARIFKVYGTMACKGDDIEERPHRRASMIWRPSKLSIAPRSLLEKLAALVPRPPKRTASNRPTGKGDFDLAKWIADHELPVVDEKPWQGGQAWILNPCPFNPEHVNRAAYVIQFPNGAIAAGCHHNGCAGKGWHDLRDLVEPGWRDRRAMDIDISQLPPAIQREYSRARRLSRRSRPQF